ncbi:MAG: DUF6067 family protein, partial [Phycisphaerae bacterium]|nr:DUF6067 family protein [Phycisphaerae bacterium]
VFLPDYPDPFAQLNPIALTGVRNGTFAGQIVISDDDIITNLKATVTDLAGPGTIPASAVAIRYAMPDGPGQPRFFDSLEDKPMEEVPFYKEHGGAIQPIWITVTVPADAKGGDYTGTVSITSDNNKDKPIALPIKLRVIDWKLPAVADYGASYDIIQSPESVAMAYDLDLWSDKHMKQLDRTFALLAPLGVKTLYVTAIRRTHFGNEQALVRWVRGEDGELSPEFSLMEKYIDVAAKHLGKVPCLILYCWEPPESQGHAGVRVWDKPVLITKFDPATGKQTPGTGPAWGTPESKVFWKKLTDGIKPVLAKHGLEDSLLFGLIGDSRPTKQAMDDITNGMDGKDRWAIHSHLYCDNWQGHPLGMVNALWGIGCSPADPSAGYSFGWSNPLRLNYYPREMKIQSTLVEHRVKLENWMGARASYTPFIAKGMGPRGLGRLGGDFWTVVRDDRGRPRSSLAARYPEAAWGQLDLNYCVPYLLGRGEKGAVPTSRSEAFREAIQEVEARIYLEKAWLDDEAKTLLGEEMMTRIRKVLDDRIRVALHSGGEGEPWYVSSDWMARSELLYTLAAEVSKKLGRDPKPNLTVEKPKK